MAARFNRECVGACSPRGMHDLPVGNHHRRSRYLSAAYPDRAVAGWGHCSAVNCAGIDPRHEAEYVHMMVSSLMCGAGAVGGVMDGWHGVGPQAGLGGGAAGDMELIEYHYPLVVHRYAFSTDSASPGDGEAVAASSMRSRRSITT